MARDDDALDDFLNDDDSGNDETAENRKQEIRVNRSKKKTSKQSKSQNSRIDALIEQEEREQSEKQKDPTEGVMKRTKRVSTIDVNDMDDDIDVNTGKVRKVRQNHPFDDSDLAIFDVSKKKKRFSDTESIRSEALDENPELAQDFPASQGMRGLLKKIGISVSPSQQELDDRRRRLDRIVGEREANTEFESINSLVNRPTKRTRNYCGYWSVVSEKGGVGKTTLSMMLACYMSESRKAPIAVADLNPDKGNLNKKFGIREPRHTISDLVANQARPQNQRIGVKEFLEKVPNYNIEVLAGENDPNARAKTSGNDVITICKALYRYMSVTILDNGTGITHSAMKGSFKVSHGMVIVIDNTNDAKEYVRSMLRYIDSLGYHELRRRVIIAINGKVVDYARLTGETTANDGFVSPESLKDEFDPWVRHVEVIPFDPHLANSGEIDFKNLREETVRSVGRIAAELMDDLVE